MSSNDLTIVLVHGAWADGSSWAKIVGPLAADGIKVAAAPLPLTSFRDDVAALDRTLERVTRPVVLVGHAYAGAVIAATRSEKVKALVYVAALAPDEGETVADVFYRIEPHPEAPKLAPDGHGLIWLPEGAFAAAFAQHAAAVEGPADLVPRGRAGPDDRAREPAFHGRAHGGPNALASRRSHATGDRAIRRLGHHP
jgi:pimeloyl-ACP methyl ester carboxylesterase